MDEEKCYVFRGPDQRPEKRQRVDYNDEDDETELDASALWKLREPIYQDLWEKQLAVFKEALNDANIALFEQIIDYIQEDVQEDGFESQAIRTGFILAGPDTTSHSALFERLEEQLKDRDSTKSTVTVHAGDAPNLRTLLKNLINSVVGSGETYRKSDKDKFLEYDLQIVHNYFQKEEKSALVIFIADSEAFQPHVIADFVQLLGSWSDRITPILLFGIATTVEIFRDRLPRETLRSIDVCQFDMVRSDELLEDLFEAMVTTEGEFEVDLRLGPSLLKTITQRQTQNIQSPEDFINAVQYAYMCHFYSNPLTIFLGPMEAFELLPKSHLDALKGLKSFQRSVERLLQDPETVETARRILTSRKQMLLFVKEEILLGQAMMDDLTRTVEIVRIMQHHLPALKPQTRSSLYIQAVEGSLLGSLFMREFLLCVKKMPSNTLERFVNIMVARVPDSHNKVLGEIRWDIMYLYKGFDDDYAIFKSRHDLQSDIIRTTVVAHKVELSRRKAEISEKDAEYSEILDKFYAWLGGYLVRTLTPAEEVPMMELIFYDGRGPDKAAFMPKHRLVVERALTSPHDYLNCDCCQNTARNGEAEAALTKTQPPTALLYQLYTESGANINVADLWTAFHGILSDDEEEADEKQIMYHFQTALAELKYLGMIKPTKRKADHVAKVSWKNL